MKADHAWKAAQGQLQMEMSRAAYDTWVRDATYISYEDGSFVIGIANTYARDWLESRLTSTVVRMLTGMMGRTVEVRFIVWQNETTDEPTTAAKPESDEPDFFQTSQRRIIPRYTFENFIVGASNRLAHAACVAIAENPAHSYNPFFLYGGVGLGKTHLLHAIGNMCIQRGLQVMYVSSEDFTNDLISAIRSHTTQSFRDRYRQIDVLLIDDIQFIAGKESTQEEFFHTFNALHGLDKQIVISSDRPPRALNTLEERLRSRFEWGLTADIQPPDFETRMAILSVKAEKSGKQIPAEITAVLARRVQSNIRELEGALTRVVAFADLSGLPLTPQLVETALVDLLPRRSTVPQDQVIRTIAETFGVPIERMLGRDRSKEVVLPRQIAMFLLREETNASLPQIGEALGGRDHTTVMHGCEKIADLIETDDRLRKQVFQLRDKIFKQAWV
jgi:chromosomal replication initiator protein